MEMAELIAAYEAHPYTRYIRLKKAERETAALEGRN